MLLERLVELDRGGSSGRLDGGPARAVGGGVRGLGRRVVSGVAGPVREPGTQVSDLVEVRQVGQEQLVIEPVQPLGGESDVDHPQTPVSMERQLEELTAGIAAQRGRDVDVVAGKRPPQQRGGLRADRVVEVQNRTDGERDCLVGTPVPSQVELGCLTVAADLQLDEVTVRVARSRRT